jgi:hypothetical protein
MSAPGAASPEHSSLYATPAQARRLAELTGMLQQEGRPAGLSLSEVRVALPDAIQAAFDDLPTDTDAAEGRVILPSYFAEIDGRTVRAHYPESMLSATAAVSNTIYLGRRQWLMDQGRSGLRFWHTMYHITRDSGEPEATGYSLSKITAVNDRPGTMEDDRLQSDPVQQQLCKAGLGWEAVSTVEARALIDYTAVLVAGSRIGQLIVKKIIQPPESEGG